MKNTKNNQQNLLLNKKRKDQMKICYGLIMIKKKLKKLLKKILILLKIQKLKQKVYLKKPKFYIIINR